MVGNDPATANNPAACAAQLHSEACTQRTRLILDSLGVNNIDALTPAQVAVFNQQMTAAGCPTVSTPATLAQTAFKQLAFLPPVFHRSPDETKTINGLPYSWVNLWTFFWTSPASWQPMSKTARAGALWATVTATPTTLTYTAGDGGSAVCPGPGRPWVASDGFDPPSHGACGYRYADYSRHPLTVTLTQTWSITWVGDGGYLRHHHPTHDRCELGTAERDAD